MLGGVPVAPGVCSFISLWSLYGQYLSNDIRIVSTTLTTGGLRAGEGTPLSTNTLDHDTPGVPFIDPAELYILEVVVPLDILNNSHYLLSLLSPLSLFFVW